MAVPIMDKNGPVGNQSGLKLKLTPSIFGNSNTQAQRYDLLSIVVQSTNILTCAERRKAVYMLLVTSASIPQIIFILRKYYFRNCLKMKQCSICLQTNVDYQTTCGHPFHYRCLSKWTIFEPGDFLDVSKTCCPECRLPLTTFLSKPWFQKPDAMIYYHNDIAQLDHNMVYRICTKCHTHFQAGSNNCSDNREEFPTICPECTDNIKIVRCPNCGNGLEHSGGCLDFVCCLYGYDQCDQLCDHGSGRLVQFYGHKWKLARDNICVIECSCGCEVPDEEDVCSRCDFCTSCCDCNEAECGCICTIDEICTNCDECKECCTCSEIVCGCRRNEVTFICNSCAKCDECCSGSEHKINVYQCGCQYDIGTNLEDIVLCQVCKKCFDCCSCSEAK